MTVSRSKLQVTTLLALCAWCAGCENQPSDASGSTADMEGLESGGSFFFGSKGVDYSQYSTFNNGHLQMVATNAADVDKNWGPAGNLNTGSFEIDGGVVKSVGYLRPTLWLNSGGGVDIWHRYVDISGNTGNPANSQLPNQPDPDTNVFLNAGGTKIVASFGFYSAGALNLGETASRSQYFMYASPERSNWMGDLSAMQSKPLKQWVLPGSHDAGMFVHQSIPGFSDAADNLGATQSNSIADQARLGIRYFDFRPGYAPSTYGLVKYFATCASNILGCFFAPTFQPNVSGGLYHIHNFLPGGSMRDAATNIRDFLLTHPSEVVIMNISTGAGVNDALQDKTDQWRNVVDDVMNGSNSGMLYYAAKDAPDNIFSVPLSDIVGENSANATYKGRRFIITQQGGNNLDSYSEKDYVYGDRVPGRVSDTVAKCRTALDNPVGAVVLQLQSTPTELLAVQADAVKGRRNGNILLGNKIVLDRTFLPRILNREMNGCVQAGPTILLNDYVDTAFVDAVYRSQGGT